MAWAVTDQGRKYTTGGAACTLNPLATIAVGSLVVVATAEHTNTASAPTVSDSGSNTYTKITQILGGGSLHFISIWYSIITTQLTTASTITYTPVTSANDNGIEVLSATGNAASSPVDSAATNSATGSGTGPVTLTSGTPSVAGDLFIAFSADTNTCRTINLDSGNGWAAPFQNGGSSQADGTNTAVATGGGNQVNAGTGTKTYFPTVSSGTPNWASLIVAFKAGAQAYTLDATTAGSYTLTGQAASLGYLFTLVAAAGAYTLTGIAVTFNRGINLIASGGAYTLTGIDAALTSARLMTASAGLYVLTGVSATLAVARILTAGTGTFVLTGVSATLARLVAPASKFKRRLAKFVLSKRRTTDPTLGD